MGNEETAAGRSSEGPPDPSSGLRVLGIVGSPRANGNSTGLIDLALEGARERGYRTDRIWLRRLKIMPCNACDGCRRGPSCIVHDDMDRVYAALHHADIVVVATPIYFYSMTGWLKALIDRTYGLLDADSKSRVTPGKKLYVITTQEEDDPADGAGVVRVLERGLEWIGMELAGSLVATGVRAEGAYLDRPDYLKAARALIQ